MGGALAVRANMVLPVTTARDATVSAAKALRSEVYERTQNCLTPVQKGVFACSILLVSRLWKGLN